MSSGKKLINNVDNCVDEMLLGLAHAFPTLHLHTKKRVVLSSQWQNNDNKVGIISGGGSGHEPFCAGYVGKGMLTAAVAGSVFASPPTSSVLHAIRSLSQGTSSGVLVIIANYTGDILNFGLAVECARNEDLQVESVVVGEDCALLLQDEKKKSAGRRGMCGLLFVYKITGAMAEQGKSLKEIAATAQKVNDSMATIGVSLSACSLPGSGPLFHIKSDEMELGLGVHGEAGTCQLKLLTAAETVKILLDALISALSLSRGDEVAVLINNLGGTSQLEQWIITNEVHSQLGAMGIIVQRIYAGLLMTSLEMAGVQVSVLKLQEHKIDWLNYLDMETSASGWPGNSQSVINSSPLHPNIKITDDYSKSKIQERGPGLDEFGKNVLSSSIDAIASVLIKHEHKLNELDSGCGDGDCGTTLRLFGEGMLKVKESLLLRYPSSVFLQLADVSENVMGGTSGAIYSLMLTTASSAMEDEKNANNPDTWSKVWRAGIEGIMKYSRAQPGDRTMLDALVPACSVYQSNKKDNISSLLETIEAVKHAASEGCESTKHMKARAGRASYVSESHCKDVDAGAYAVALWLNAISDVLIALLSQT